MELSRRKLFAGATALIAAPALVRFASLMPVKVWAATDIYRHDLYVKNLMPEGEVGIHVDFTDEGNFSTEPQGKGWVRLSFDRKSPSFHVGANGLHVFGHQTVKIDYT